MYKLLLFVGLVLGAAIADFNMDEDELVRRLHIFGEGGGGSAGLFNFKSTFWVHILVAEYCNYRSSMSENAT